MRKEQTDTGLYWSKYKNKNESKMNNKRVLVPLSKDYDQEDQEDSMKDILKMRRGTEVNRIETPKLKNNYTNKGIRVKNMLKEISIL